MISGHLPEVSKVTIYQCMRDSIFKTLRSANQCLTSSMPVVLVIKSEGCQVYGCVTLAAHASDIHPSEDRQSLC